MVEFQELEKTLAALLASRNENAEIPDSNVLPAAVLVLFGLRKTGVEILFLLRTETVEKHKGQIAFPGGKCDNSDFLSGSGFISTALRETEEEVGISREDVKVIGTMPSILTRTGFIVTPVVAALSRSIEDIELRVNSAEVSEAFWLPLHSLMKSSAYRIEHFFVGEDRFPTDVFRVGYYRIWGVTGSILKNVLDTLRLLK